MTDSQSIDEMLHYMKTGKKSISDDIKKMTKDSKEWCPFLHGKTTNDSCYRINPSIKHLIEYLKKYAICFEFLGINIYGLKEINEGISVLEDPSQNSCFEIFKENLVGIIGFIENYEDSIHKQINLLTCEESTRLDEAINTFFNCSFASSVIMAVCAVESRLHHLLLKKNKTLYNQNFKKATLGQLIQLFDDNNYKDKKFAAFKKILPLQYKPLMEILNYYRIYSAHPKIKRIDYKIAQSILNFSFGFLLDDETRIDKRLTKCK